MKALFIATAVLAVIGVPPLIAQSSTMAVCEALNSVKDHQAVTIRGTFVAFRDGAWIYEGRNLDPCPGWPSHLFTAPAVVSISVHSDHGVIVPDQVNRECFDFLSRLLTLWRSNPRARHTVAVLGGVLPFARAIFLEDPRRSLVRYWW